MKAMTTMVQGMKEQNSWDMFGCNFVDDEVKRAINSDKR